MEARFIIFFPAWIALEAVQQLNKESQVELTQSHTLREFQLVPFVGQLLASSKS